MDYWESKGIVKPQQVVVCAANRLPNGVILCGARHWDKIMRAQADAMGWFDNRCGREEQGFIDQFGDFLTREEAMGIVKKNGQAFNIKRNGGLDIELYTEGLY